MGSKVQVTWVRADEDPRLFVVLPEGVLVSDPRVQQIERLLDDLASDYNQEKGDVVRANDF